MGDPNPVLSGTPGKKQPKPPAKPCPIDEQVQKTYRLLRLTAALIAIAFPPLLWFCGCVMGHIPLRYCMSDYYWAAPNQLCPCDLVNGVCQFCQDKDAICQKKETKVIDPQQNRLNEQNLPPGTMRSWFVGLLFATGAVLFVNRGYTKEEDIALSVAGILAWGIALFPEHWTCYKDGLSMHGICALGFFAAIAYVAIFCSRNTLDLLPKDSKKKDGIDLAYKVISVAMVVSPVTAFIFNFVSSQHSWMFYAEWLGIYAFAAYWLVKSYEIKAIQNQYKERKSKALPSESVVAPLAY